LQGKKTFFMQGRYASAKQMKHAAKQTRKLKTIKRQLTWPLNTRYTQMDEAPRDS